MSEQVEFFGKEWCAKAVEIWDEVAFPNLADPGNYHYVVEWGESETGTICQFKADHGKIVSWEPGKSYSDEECDFLLWGVRENWKKIGEGKLDPVGAVASKRLHLRKGPMAVVIKEADAFKRILIGFGRIPTAW